MTARKVKKAKKAKVQKDGLISATIVWKDAYPFIEETYRVGEETIVVMKYPYLDAPDSDKFLYQVIRSSALPTFMKNNLKKIRKLLEKEIQHRDKLYEKLSKEQVKSFHTYFQDENFFDKSLEDEYFEHEIEKVFAVYVREYLSTGLYESRARLSNRKRSRTLKQHGIEP